MKNELLNPCYQNKLGLDNQKAEGTDRLTGKEIVLLMLPPKGPAIISLHNYSAEGEMLRQSDSFRYEWL